MNCCPSLCHCVYLPRPLCSLIIQRANERDYPFFREFTLSAGEAKMQASTFAATFSSFFAAALLACVHLPLRTAAGNETSCNYGLKPLWSASLRNTPLIAPPLLFDVDGDGYGDIVSPSTIGEVWSVHGENGHIVDNWPFYLEDRGFQAGPLVYDVNKDGVLEFLLTTTDGELVFLHTNNTLLHGETIKIPPLRVRRYWYQLDKDYLQKLMDELKKQLGDSERLIMGTEKQGKPHPPRPPSANIHQHSAAFSEFESQYGRHADPLYSRHHPEKYVTGLDPQDVEIVHVDPHVLATPTLSDIDGDGVYNELVVPVSYYFDPFEYGDPHVLADLGGLPKDELVNYVAGGIVVVNLATGVIGPLQLLGLTRASDTQPAYILSSPTVVRLSPGNHHVTIVVGTAAGEVHALQGGTMKNEPGFPVAMDSVSAQVAVADLLRNRALELVVGDNSGNVYCLDFSGRLVWEFEAREAISSPASFADVDGDSALDVIIITEQGSLWVLHGISGTPFHGYPIRLTTYSQAPPLLLHLTHSGHSSPSLSAIIPTMSSLFLVDLRTQCVESLPPSDILTSNLLFFSVLSGDIDPYSDGIEILSIALDGQMVCYATGGLESGDKHVTLESWSGDTLGHNLFTHKSNSFAMFLPWLNETVREISGRSFLLDFELLDNGPLQLQEYSITVTIGQKYLLYNGTLPSHQRRTQHSLLVPTPAEPVASFLTVRVCNEHLQCQSISHHARFNLLFQDTLKWYLCLPFLVLTAALLWLLRDEDYECLPGAGFRSTARKSL